MVNLDKLMFTREHFPVLLHETTGYREEKFWDFGRIEIPPYHPSMAKDRINFKLVQDLLYEAIEATVKDLEEIADKRIDVQAILRGVVKDEKTGRILFEPQVVKQDDLGIKIHYVPIVSHFYVGKEGINPYDEYGDQGISIRSGGAAPSFNVPKEVIFTPEIMSEYKMTDVGDYLLGKKEIKCPNLWHRHNLGTINAIFYKNLVVALDNAVIKEKYSVKDQSQLK